VEINGRHFLLSALLNDALKSKEISVGEKWMSQCEASVELYWQGNTEVFGEKLGSIQFCLS